ncbi:ABC-three component system middle component 2 [Aeromonas veronii]|uniref:ABC-three component system middle component 2 n=1 Tax=Aeromonas veronii TaxID=654 RepID=UPI003BA1DD68
MNIYNSDLEISIRISKILIEFNNVRLNLEHLICIDFLVLNLKDFIPNYNSLHPAIPRRDTQLAIKRKLFQDALNLMKNYHLVKEIFSEDGFRYTSSDKTFSFTNAIQNEYIKDMEKNIITVKEHFGELSETNLKLLIASRFGKLDLEITNA